jgi:hypothetical protein
MAMPEATREFRPHLSARSSEITTWTLVALTGAAWWFLSRGDSIAPSFITWMFSIFVFVALGTSLGNWMDRQTVLRLTSQGVEFSNGLRNVKLKWDAIRAVNVTPSRWGQSAHVVGETGHFQLRLSSEVNLLGRVKEPIGFADSQEILHEVIERSGLMRVEHDQPGSYYARG